MAKDVHHESTYVHVSGKKYNVRWFYDYDTGSPLDYSDCHGETERLDWNPTDAEQLEQHILDYEPEVEEVARLTLMRLLAYPTNRYDSGLYYDVMRSMHKAKTEWGCKTHDECVAAVEQDYKYLRGYYNEDWFYLTLSVAPIVIDEDGYETIDDDAREYCGGFESTILDDDEDNVKWRNEAINDQIHEVEWALRRLNHPNQMELKLEVA